MTAGDDAVVPGPWTNGLLAPSYVALTDVSAPLAPRLLSALERARIAAYLAQAPEPGGGLRLYVASAERSDARTIVAAVVRATGSAQAGTHGPTVPSGANPPTEPAEPVAAGGLTGSAADLPDRAADPLAGIDADAAFAALTADWHVDTHAAIRDAERQLSREDENWRARLNAEPVDSSFAWLDEDHFVPPTPPPLPRPTGPFVLGFLLLIGSICLLAFGGTLGLPFELSLFLAVSGILSATTIFVLRLRPMPDEDDDGAIL